MGPKEFAIRTGKPEKTIIAILKGDSSITPEMAVLFESVLKIPANFWIKRQYSFDEYKAKGKRAVAIEQAKDWAKLFPFADMVKYGWVKAKSKTEEKVTDQPDDFFEQLQKICLACGVKVVYTPCIKKAPLSGATRWIGNTPLIQLSGRYNQNDRFWFTFFHEAGHIILHGKKDVFLEDIDFSDTDLQKEEEVNAFAVKWTFSKEEEEELLKQQTLSPRIVAEYAKQIGTHPAMITGRLHFKKLIPYSVGRTFYKKLNLNLD